MEPLEVRDNRRGFLELGLINPRGLALILPKLKRR
jgi:hypothetical protein